MTSTQLPSDIFLQAPTIQVKIDRRTDDGNPEWGGGGGGVRLRSYSGNEIIMRR
jgi:hypothetical protein